MMNICVDEKVNYVAGDTKDAAFHVVVAVPDLCIQEMLQVALELRGYRVTCTPIDLLHPMAWLFKAMRARPTVVIVDIDFFHFCTVQQSIFTVLNAWPQMPGIPSPSWIWLSRRPFYSHFDWVIAMPFRLAHLEARVREACQSRFQIFQ